MEKRIKIDFLVPPFDGHLNPLLELAKKINNENKYEIRFITGKDKNDKIDRCQKLQEEQKVLQEKQEDIKQKEILIQKSQEIINKILPKN